MAGPVWRVASPSVPERGVKPRATAVAKLSRPSPRQEQVRKCTAPHGRWATTVSQIGGSGTALELGKPFDG